MNLISQKKDKSSNKRSESLKGTLWTLTGILLVIYVSIFVVVTMAETTRAERDYEIRESETVLNSISGGILAEIDNYKDISRLIMIQEDVVNYLKAGYVSSGLRNDAVYGIMDMLNTCKYIDSVFIIRNDGNYMSTGKGIYRYDHDLISTDEWAEPVLTERGGAVIMMNANDAIFRSDGEPVVTIARAIYDIYTQKQTGILLMNINRNMFIHAVRQQGTNAVGVFDPKGMLIAGEASLTDLYSSDYRSFSAVHNDRRVNGTKRQMVSGETIKGTPLTVICITEADTAVVPRETILLIILLPLAFLIFAVILGYFISRNITRPIINLASEIDSAGDSGWLEPLETKVPDNEIGILEDSYNSMIDHMNGLFIELIEKEKSVQRAEMRVLHEQIKPHFLYNSLETISAMAIDDGAEDVHSALETLGSFYRNFLSKGDREIPLKREISIIKDYLSLQKLRYGEVISDEYDIDENTLDCMIPKLILQPLVENSINHGIRLKGEPGIIRISSRLQNNELLIVVHDTGVGISPEQIDSLLEKKTYSDSYSEGALSGFGLKGTISRIRYYCDRDDVVRISSEVGEYTDIELRIPLMLAERKHE